LGRGASGGGLCGPVFNEFMLEAIAEYGGGPFDVPEGGAFFPIDRFTGQRLEEGATGDNVVYELFRAGEEPFFGAQAIIDGGWAMGSDLPLYGRGEGGAGDLGQGQAVTTSIGEEMRVPTQSGFGTLSSGGLY
jgi:penicillin-binding protein 1A